MITQQKYTKLDFAVEENPNLGVRKSMEDYTIAEPDLFGDSKYAFFCVFDGHGGNSVAKYMKENYLKLLKTRLDFYRNAYSIVNILRMTIDNIEKQLQMIGGRDCGSTFCGLLFDLQNKRVYSINIGDSKALKLSLDKNCKSSSRYLTIEHKASNVDEIRRVEKQGGCILNGRLAGNLLVTRSLGDFDFKKYGLVSTPDVEEIDLEENQTYIIASDGIWDVLEIAHVEKYTNELSAGNLRTVAKKLSLEAVKLGSTDNISLILIKT